MSKLKFLYCLFGVLLLTACSQEDVPTPPNETQSTTRVSLQQALQNADRVFSKLSDGTRTVRRVKDVQTLGSGVTRSNSEEPLYYVVNYEDEAGFAVLGADTRLDDVYAIGEEGHLDMNDTITNPGLAMFFSDLPHLPNNPFNPNDTTSQIIVPNPEPLAWNGSFKRGPYLAAPVRKWHQGWPYNFLCPYIGSEQSPVGCSALASAQIMSFYKWPQSYNGMEFNWEEMTAWNWDMNGSYDLPTLLSELGKPENLNIEYGGEQSSARAFTITVKRTFENFGYTVYGDFKNYNQGDLVFLIKNQEKPVIMLGSRLGETAAHAWICDGLYYDIHYYKDPITEQLRSHGDGCFFHMIWGREYGQGNGYFKISDTMSVSNKYRDSEDFPISSWTDDLRNQLNYTNNLRYWGGYSPNK